MPRVMSVARLSCGLLSCGATENGLGAPLAQRAEAVSLFPYALAATLAACPTWYGIQEQK